jgi:hypothetical protein
MKPSELPGEPLSALSSLLTSALEAAGDSYTRAEYFVRFSNPLRSSTRNASGLTGLEPAEERIPLASETEDLALDALLEASRKANRVIHSLDYVFEKTNRGWTHDLSIESLDEYRGFRSELAPREERLVKMAAELGGASWTRIAVSRSSDKPDKLVVVEGKKRDFRDLPPPLREELDALQTFFRERGRNLLSVDFELEGGPGDYQSNQDYYYRLIQRRW